MRRETYCCHSRTLAFRVTSSLAFCILTGAGVWGRNVWFPIGDNNLGPHQTHNPKPSRKLCFAVHALFVTQIYFNVILILLWISVTSAKKMQVSHWGSHQIKRDFLIYAWGHCVLHVKGTQQVAVCAEWLVRVMGELLLCWVGDLLLQRGQQLLRIGSHLSTTWDIIPGCVFSTLSADVHSLVYLCLCV